MTLEMRALAPLSVVMLAWGCVDQGEASLPAGPMGAGPASGPPTAEGARVLARIAPPVDVVSTQGAIAAWPRIVPGVDAHAITSFDRAGGNDDGFNGTYSSLYEEGGEHVIFDA